jgi:hypothetical protein
MYAHVNLCPIHDLVCALLDIYLDYIKLYTFSKSFRLRLAVRIIGTRL